MGRWLATAGIALLLLLDLALPLTPIGRRGPEAQVRSDVEGAHTSLGEPFPDLTLIERDGDPLSTSALQGVRSLLTFERSIDWCPYTKARLVELRDALNEIPDLVIVYVLPDVQVTPKSLRFIEELGLEDRVTFAMDPESAAIHRLGLIKRDPEPIEDGVPNPTTYILDRQGVLRFADVRTDYHRWIDSDLLVEQIGRVP